MTAMTRTTSLASGVRTFFGDLTEGFMEITHNGLTLLGALLLLVVLVLGLQPDLRAQGEDRLSSWLTARKIAAVGMTPEPTAIQRTTAVNPGELPTEQANVAMWISRKYRVAPEPVGALVAEAYELGEAARLEPTLILAVMAIESRFNPFAQSPVGAQGLMQVMTKVHAEKYEHFGGRYAAFDPKSNLRVGVNILEGYIKRAGSVAGGLKYYVGAANLATDGGYGKKVIAEYARLYRVAKGKPLPSPAPALLEARSSTTPAKAKPERVALLVD